MDKIFDIIDSFERKTMLGIFRLRKMFSPKSVEKLSNKIEEVVEDYNELIADFNLIQQGKSTKSRKERDAIKRRVAFLIEKGHLKFN